MDPWVAIWYNGEDRVYVFIDFATVHTRKPFTPSMEIGMVLTKSVLEDPNPHQASCHMVMLVEEVNGCHPGTPSFYAEKNL